MNQATIINVIILAIVAMTIFLTKNPLALFGVLLLREMPYGLIAPPEAQGDADQPPEDYTNRNIGFHTD